MVTKVKIQKMKHYCDPLPSYATEGSAGMDLVASNVEPITLKVGERALVPTGVAIALPFFFEAQIRPRSGLALKHGVTVVNSPGTIDSDYRGEIKVLLINLGDSDFTITRGMRIAQMIIARYEKIAWEESDSLEDTVRGAQGFGSTGH